MNVVGRVGSLISQGVYSVATPFHPFGGAVDIIAVEQPDGSYRSTPWYVRFGKFQGVLKGAEKVVTITVNGVDANFHMLLDNSGQAYFMRELVPGSEGSGIASEGAINEPEPPARSKSDGELYMGSHERPGSPELDVEHQEKQTREEFNSYSYDKLEEAENLAKQADGTNSEMVLVSVDGHILTAPISSTGESMEDVQLSDPQFHLGPGQSSSGDFSRSGEVWESGILDDDLYIPQEKIKFDTEHQPEASEEHGEVPIEEDDSHHIPDNENEVLHVSFNEAEDCIVSSRENEIEGVSRSRNEGLNDQPLTIEDEAHDISGDNDEGYQLLPNKGDESEDFVVSSSENEIVGVSGSGNNGLNDQPLTIEDDDHDISGNNSGRYEPLSNEVEALDVPENNDEGYQPLRNEDETCDIPLVENGEDCVSPAKVDKVCAVSTENIDLENAGATLGRYDTFRSCLDLTSQIDEGDSGNEAFSPESDRQRDFELSLSNRSDVYIDMGGSDDNRTQSEDNSAHYHGKESDLSSEGGSHDRSKDTASSEFGVYKSDSLHSTPRSSAKDKLGSIPENSADDEELNEEERARSLKGLGFDISLCGHMLQPGMGRTSAEEIFQQHLVLEEDFKLSGQSIIKNPNLVVKVDSKYFTWSKVSHVILGKAVFGPDFHVEPIDAIPVGSEEMSNPREGSPGMSPSRRWRLWPIPFRISRSLQRSNSDASEDIFLDTETVLSPIDDEDTENSKSQSPRRQFVRTLIPTSEQVASLNLKDGQNMVTFSFCTRVFGKQQVDAHIYLWKWNAKIVISDVDGTITRSDVLGQVMPLVGRDWSQSGVARLFSAIKENGYQLIFLSARAIVQAYLTKNFLFNLKQDGKVLPNGPVVISPDGLFPSLYREVIRRAPHEFKIACLEDIKALFPSDYNPFYAGFGNRDTDELSYKKMGIPKGKIFIINPKGEVAINSSVDVKSYTSLHTLVNDMFPPTTLVEQEDYNSWNYWKMPLPDVDL